ncbi:hypothetical protein [Blastococcus sp. URHD0036]|uniref:hypothetical protein n=1 Tax=Blastococcus sp. URHD0036 TaxID=1380356 RepID=UPI000497E957|nr:hypothetical protein [Blastococcus sp. URHD0036]
MRLRALALAGLSTVLLTACGSTIDGSASPAGTLGAGPGPSAPADAASDAPTGPELNEAAIDALEQAGSVRIAGSMTMDGEQAEMDLRLSGDDVAGSMTVQGFTVQLLVVGGAFYMQAPEEMWTSQGVPPVMAAGLAGTWVLVPGGEQEFADFSIAGMVEEMRSPGATIEEEVGDSELDGQPVHELRDSEGAVMLVAAVGPPYPLQFSKTGAEAGVVRLSEFGTVAPIDPPADFLDLEDLGG